MTKKKDVWKLAGLLSVMFVCIGIMWMSSANSAIGTPVPNDVAATLRGGACDAVATNCPHNPFGKCEKKDDLYRAGGTGVTSETKPSGTAFDCGTSLWKCEVFYQDKADCAEH